ncbi:Rv3235 family protein [Actinomyces oricola]|uniref:Rv3235 family protein n=1 Tax=Actinomyces oricola TaxID=206043 RepID=UPI000FFE8854|nr:Rv3235 family protein [Actinomyces oricola]
MTATLTSPPPAAQPEPRRRRPAPSAPRTTRSVRRSPRAGTPVARPVLTATARTTDWDRLRFQPRLATPAGRGAGGSPAACVPAPSRAAASLVAAAAEVLCGLRPVQHLMRWTTPDLFDALARRAGLASRLLGEQAGARPRARSVHLQSTASGAQEATVLLDDGERVRAAAARLEPHHGRWVLANLEIA